MNKITKSNKCNNEILIFITGCIIGFLVFGFVFTFSSLDVTNDSFFITGFVENDTAQHYAGWMLYRQSPWQFPLGVSLNGAFPYGTSVTYTDSIPILSIFFKILSPILPATFQFFGIAVALFYSLMGGFSALLINHFTNNYIISSISAAIFSFSTVMMERAFRHTALTAHFLIIACIYFYFKGKKEYCLKNSIALIILCTISVGIHPYFLPFTFGIAFAYFIEWSISKKQLIKPIIFLASSLVSTLVFGYIIGAFYSFDSAQEFGYGVHYTLNINSYFNPISKNIANWSAIRNPLGMYRDTQVEAFNYLGVGIFIALIIAFIIFIVSKKVRKEIFTIIKESYGLVFTLFALTLFALSNTITLHNFVLVSIPLPSFVYEFASIFRASGRFGWLLHYVFYIVSIVIISKVKLKPLAYLILSLTLIIQVYDISPIITLKNNYFKGEGYEGDRHTMTQLATDEFWDVLFNDFDSVISIQDGTSINNGAIEFAIRAGKKNNGMTVNLTFEARALNDERSAFINSVNEDLLNGIIDEDTFYLVADADIYEKYIISGEYQAFLINGQAVILKLRYSQEAIKPYLNSQTFSEIIY